MEIEFDPTKRVETLEARGLDFARAGEAFDGFIFTVEDQRFDYGEVRYQTVGELDGHVVMIVWTPRGRARRIISMRRCHEGTRDEYYRRRLGRS